MILDRARFSCNVIIIVSLLLTCDYEMYGNLVLFLCDYIIILCSGKYCQGLYNMN